MVIVKSYGFFINQGLLFSGRKPNLNLYVYNFIFYSYIIIYRKSCLSKIAINLYNDVL
jgi:hypothetical protein